MIILLIIGIIIAVIIAKITKKEWLGPITCGLFFILYGALSFSESQDAFYSGILACFVQFVVAYRMYKMQLLAKK